MIDYKFDYVMVAGKLTKEELKHVVSVIPYRPYQNKYFDLVYFDKDLPLRILVYPKNMYARRYYNIIISFHPDNPPELALDILRMIGKARLIIKRIDTAFDIQNEYSDTFILPAGTRTRQKYIKGSEYFGSHSSDFVISRYDKSLQLTERKGLSGIPPTTRVEYRIKKQQRNLVRLKDFDVSFYMPLNEYRILPSIASVKDLKVQKWLYDINRRCKTWNSVTNNKKKAIREAVEQHLVNPFEYIHVPNMDTGNYLPQCLQLA